MEACFYGFSPFYVLCCVNQILASTLRGLGGFQSPDDHHARFVRSVPADLPDDRVASDFVCDPGGDGVSYGMAGVQSVYRHLLPEEDWKAYEYVDMPECWYIKKRNRSFIVRVICFSFCFLKSSAAINSFEPLLTLI